MSLCYKNNNNKNPLKVPYAILIASERIVIDLF